MKKQPYQLNQTKIFNRFKKCKRILDFIKEKEIISKEIKKDSLKTTKI